MGFERTEIRFTSGRSACAAWHYPGTSGGCVVMAAGAGVDCEPGTDRFAARFGAAGHSVLAFDYRHFGRSGGHPRQVLRIREQLQDWAAAIECARGLPEVDPARVAVWGASVSGGHVLLVAAGDPRLQAAIAQTPALDGPAATRQAARHQTPLALLRTIGLALIDASWGALLGKPVLVPLSGPPGSVALLTTPDARDGRRILDPEHRYPSWQSTIAARSLFALSRYRPGRHATDVRRPLLVVVADNDQSALSGPALSLARSARDAELVHLPGGHYSPYGDGYEEAVRAELAFLDRQLSGGADPRAEEPSVQAERPASPTR